MRADIVVVVMPSAGVAHMSEAGFIIKGSSHRRPLKLSMKAFCIGLPGAVSGRGIRA